jgi:hypothetical protein
VPSLTKSRASGLATELGGNLVFRMARHALLASVANRFGYRPPSALPFLGVGTVCFSPPDHPLTGALGPYVLFHHKGATPMLPKALVRRTHGQVSNRLIPLRSLSAASRRETAGRQQTWPFPGAAVCFRATTCTIGDGS